MVSDGVGRVSDAYGASDTTDITNTTEPVVA